MTDGPGEVVFLDGAPPPGGAEDLPAPGPAGTRRRLAYLAGAAIVVAGGITLARATGGADSAAPATSTSASPPPLGVTPADRPIPLPTGGLLADPPPGQSGDDIASLQLVHTPICPAAPCTFRAGVPASVRRTILHAIPGAVLGSAFSVFHNGRLVSRELNGHVGRGKLVVDVVTLRDTEGPTVEASVDEGAVRGTAEVTGYLVAAEITPGGRALFLPVQRLLGHAAAVTAP